MNLLHRIEIVLERAGISQTRFGRRAIGDPRLIGDLRRGRKLRPGTESRVRAALAQLEAGDVR